MKHNWPKLASLAQKTLTPQIFAILVGMFITHKGHSSANLRYREKLGITYTYFTTLTHYKFKLVDLEMLYKQTGWESLEARRTKHELCPFYKMENNTVKFRY